MKSNIFVPKTITVGYQDRKDTYTGKLAYVIYTDEKGVLRKYNSWNNWRDINIEPDNYDNTPMSGFVLNKKVGDTQSHWNFRQAYCRVYDPRGFEFEITIENLLYILENTNSIVGKGLEGEFVYGWDGKDLVLLPTCSPDYKEIQKFNDLVFSEENITAKDLVVGRTYLCRDNSLYIYLGKYDKYDSILDYNQVVKNNGKHLWFAHFKDVNDLEAFNAAIPYDTAYAHPKNFISYRKSLPKKFFISTYDANTSPYLSQFIETIKRMPEYSPVDMDNVKISFFTEERFTNYIEDWIDTIHDRPSCKVQFCSKPHNDISSNFEIRADYCWTGSEYIFKGCGIYRFNHMAYLQNTPYRYSTFTYSNGGNPIQSFGQLTENEIRTIFNEYKPCYIDAYLKNGNYYKTVYEWLPKLEEE